MQSRPSAVIVVDATPPADSSASKTVTSKRVWWRESDHAQAMPAAPAPTIATLFFVFILNVESGSAERTMLDRQCPIQLRDRKFVVITCNYKSFLVSSLGPSTCPSAEVFRLFRRLCLLRLLRLLGQIFHNASVVVHGRLGRRRAVAVLVHPRRVDRIEEEPLVQEHQIYDVIPA